MRAILPFVLALALVGGCAAKQEAEPAAEGAAATGGHPALNKLNETKTKMGDIEAKRAQDQKDAQGEAAGQDP